MRRLWITFGLFSSCRSPYWGGRGQARLQASLRANRYDQQTKVLTIDPVRARAFASNEAHYANVFKEGRRDGHAALFGVYGMLGIGLMLFCFRAMRPNEIWREGTLSVAFWAIAWIR